MPLERGWKFDPENDPFAVDDFPSDPAPKRVEPEFSRPDDAGLDLVRYLVTEAERIQREALARAPKVKPKSQPRPQKCSRAEYIDTQLFGQEEEEK